VPILFSHPPFKYKSNILNRPLGSGRVVSVLKFVGRVWVGSVGSGQETWTHVHLWFVRIETILFISCRLNQLTAVIVSTSVG